MNTIIKYTNLLGQTITEEQMLSLKEFNKLTFIDGLLKIKEHHIESSKIGKCVEFCYFLSGIEDKNVIVQQYTNQQLNHRCTVYFNEYFENGYTLWDKEGYSNAGILKRKFKEVFNQDRKMIMQLKLNIENNNVIEAEKYYYKNQIQTELDDLLLEFEYDDKGQLTYIKDVNEFYGYIWQIDLKTFLEDIQFSQIDFPWDKNTYYHSLYPLIPGGHQ